MDCRGSPAWPVRDGATSAHIQDMNSTPSPSVTVTFDPSADFRHAAMAEGTVHRLPDVENLRLMPTVISAGFESEAGEELLRAAEHLPRVSADRTLRAANLLVEPLRCTYPAYVDASGPADDRDEAVTAFHRRLSALSPLAREYHLALVSYAVHTEMKFRANPAYILNPDHDFELLIDPADYETEEDLLGRGLAENIERLAVLADTAAAYAVSDTQAAELDAGREAKSA